MDSYIIRIYRREKEAARSVVGTAERVGDEGKKAFKSLDELWEILNEPLPNMAPSHSRKEGERGAR
jgi:hypothetical protein